VENAMKAAGGLLTRADLAAYAARRRTPLEGRYRGLDVVSMPPSSGGGTALLEMLNILEGYDLAARGPGSAAFVHVATEAMRRAYADRARFLGDPDFNPAMPIERLISRSYAEELRQGIREDRASTSAPDRFGWPRESPETTHVSVVDAEGNAVALTYTLEGGYGSRIVVPGAGFLLNNEMGDFNAGPGLTDREGLIGTGPNLAAPGKRMLSSMTPTILSKDGRVFMVVGAAGGRKIANAVLLTILNVVDFGMNAQQAVDTPRFHHQWLPDQILHERWGLSADALERLHALGHTTSDAWPAGSPTAVHAIVRRDNGELEGGVDRRTSDGAALGH
jgi:gamma-glutamyltranspeptidase/glutathione hydrolase